MNITLSGTKVSMDGHTLAFQKNNLVDSMVITVDTDETWQYKLDVKYPCKDSNGEELYNVIDLTRVGNTCTAILQASMLPFNGKYTMQLRGISGNKVYHTDTFDVWVKYSIDPGKVYDPVPSEFYQIEYNITSMNNHPPKPGDNGYWLIWNVLKQEYEESDIPLPEDTLPEVSDSTNGWYLTNDGERVYWAEVQGGSGEGDITAIQVNGVDQPIVDKVAKLTIDKDTVGLSNLDNVRQYSSVNPPPYPVTSVNGETGAVTLSKADVGLGNVDNVKQYSASNPPPYPVVSVNGQTGDVVLNAESIGALPSTTKIPSATSDLTNDSGYITAAGAPVQSVDGQTGEVVTNAVKTTAQTLTDDQKTQARTNIGAGTSSFSGVYNDLIGKPPIPSKTSELDNDSGFVDAAGASAAAPVQSVNAKTGAVVLTQDDVGNGTTYVRTHNDFTDAAKQQINTNEDNIAMLDSDIEAAQGDITTLKGNVTTLTTALQSKQDKIVGGASTITDDNLAANRALVSDGNGKVAVSNVTSTELSYLDGVTSNVQTQLDNKLESAPVTSVNAKTGAVVLGASDVGAVATSDVTQTLGTSTTKVPSEKAVADALSGAGAGDMLKATYDPTGSVAQAGGIPDYVADQLPTVNDATLTIQKNGATVGTFTANASTNKSINITMAKGDVGLSNVDNVKQYSADNPPPYPVTSVNGKTGAVTVPSVNVPSTTSLIKGDGSGGLVAASRGSDYIASGNIVKQTLVASETTPTEDYAINWVYE